MESGLANKLFEIGRGDLAKTQLMSGIEGIKNTLISEKPNTIPELDTEYRYFVTELLGGISEQYLEEAIFFIAIGKR